MSATERIYLDNAATSFPKPDAVYDAVDHYNRSVGVAVGRGAYRQAMDVQARKPASRIVRRMPHRTTKVVWCAWSINTLIPLSFFFGLSVKGNFWQNSAGSVLPAFICSAMILSSRLCAHAGFGVKTPVRTIPVQIEAIHRFMIFLPVVVFWRIV